MSESGTDRLGIRVADRLRSYADWIGAREYDPEGIYGVVFPGVLRYFDLPEVEP